MRQCIHGGVSKINVNKLVLEDYLQHLRRSAPTMSLTQLIEEGVEEVVMLMEWQMRVCRSSGEA